MAGFTPNSLIERARVWVDDDHDDKSGWIKPEKWIQIFITAYERRYKQWVRMGLISVAPTDRSFVGPGSTVIPNVLAIIGVAEDLGGGRYRVLQPQQSQHGRAPIWSTANTTMAYFWKGTGTGTDVTVSVVPAVSGNFFARYIQAEIFDITTLDPANDSFDLPYGADELLVLDMAKAAHVKDSTRSAALEDVRREQEAEMNFSAFGRANGDSPRIRSTPRSYQASLTFPTDPRLYAWR